MKIAKDIRKEPVKMALAILLAIQFFLISFSNITLIDRNLDCDTGNLFNHISEIWRQKSILLPDWDYLTTLEWDCSSIFALPFYAVTQNIVLSFGLSNILFLGCFLCIIFFLFRGEDLLYPLLCTNLLIIPFRIGMLDYYNMLFFGGGQYIIKVSIPLLLAGLILHLNNQQAKEHLSISIKLLMAGYLGLFLLSSMSSGVYVTVCGVFPVFAAYIGYKFLKWERMPNSTIFLMICSGVFTLLGWKINTMLMGGAVGNRMTLCSVHQMLASISTCFFGMFELYGGATESFELQVLSVKGIQVLAKCMLVLVMLIAGIYEAKNILCSPKYLIQETASFRTSEDNPWNNSIPWKKSISLRTLLLLSVFIWNVFVLIISFPRGGSSTYEYRYHLIGMLPLMCVTCIFLIGRIRNLQTKQQNWLYAAGYVAILFLCAVSYKELFSKEEQHADLKEFCSYVSELDAEYIYLFDGSNDADICRVIDETSNYICLLDNGRTWAYNYYNYYVDAPMQTNNVVVAVNNEEYQFGDSFEIAGHLLIKFDSVANRSLYYFTN